MKRRIFTGALIACLMMGQVVAAEEFQAGMAEEVQVPEVSRAIVPTTVSSGGPFDSSGLFYSLGETLGTKSGYIHPYLSIGETFTDNLFNEDSNRKSDFITRIIPGIWLARPASRFQPISLNTINTAPGGLELTRFRDKGPGRFQAFAGYQADVLLHKRFDEEDRVNHKAQALLSYNFRGGLGIEVLNVYEMNSDPYSTGDSTELDKFRSNLLNAVITYDIGPKTSVEAEYGFYSLNYSSDRNSFRERDDHRFSGRAFYRFMPRTSLILEYNYIDINYDQNLLSDSNEHQILGGIQWEQTAKSRWRFLAGYSMKDFDQPGIGEASNLLAEVQFNHRFTPKSFMQVQFSRRTNESETVGVDYILSHRLYLRYYQRILPNLLASLNFYYRESDYRGESRKDDYFGAGFDLSYMLTRWLTLAGGYEFAQRDSNVSGRDYDSNTAFINFVFSL